MPSSAAEAAYWQAYWRLWDKKIQCNGLRKRLMECEKQAQELSTAWEEAYAKLKEEAKEEKEHDCLCEVRGGWGATQWDDGDGEEQNDDSAWGNPVLSSARHLGEANALENERKRAKKDFEEGKKGADEIQTSPPSPSISYTGDSPSGSGSSDENKSNEDAPAT
tara:strand:- start:17 stop:508 length:492 start_codon:yes stop_codon:yes gene_type:complete